MYDVFDVAKYAINYGTKRGTPISNLQLQKILYYIQLNFYRKLDKPAFMDDFIAWPYGPVVERVYHEFSIYGSSDICKIYPEVEGLFVGNDRIVVDFVIHACIKISAWELVGKSHRKNGPWDKVYRGGIGNGAIIPKENIITYAKTGG